MRTNAPIWALALLILLLLPSQASALSFWLSDETGLDYHDPWYAVNEAIYISGEWDVYDFPCAIGHIYLVPNGVYSNTETYDITDYVTRKTVQGCMGFGAFYGALLKLPPLPLGEYDIILDENQDGQFNPGTDLMLETGDAWTLKVIDQTLDQEVDVAAIKADAAEQAADWRYTGHALNVSFTAVNMLSSVLSGVALAIDTGERALGIAYAVVGLAGDLGLHPVPMGYEGSVIGGGKGLMKRACLNTASVYQDIANDPPDYSYELPVLLEPIAYELTASAGALPNAMVGLYNNVAEQEALGAAFLHSYEKFLGAEEHAKYEYALLQLRSAQEYCNLLSGTLDQARDRIDEVESAVTATGWIDSVFVADTARTLQQRVLADGYTEAEIQEMLAAGMSTAEIETTVVNLGALDLVDMVDTDYRTLLGTLRLEAESALSHYDSVSLDIDGALARLEFVWTPQPVASIASADSVAEGGIVLLDATASTDPRDLALTYDWDLNLDGLFDDAATETVSYRPQREGKILVGLKVTNSLGDFDVAYRRLVAVDVNRIPEFVAWTPTAIYQQLAFGTTTAFSADVLDPDGDTPALTWLLDDTEVGSGATYEFAATSSGVHHLMVRASDGSAQSPDNYQIWRILVGDGTSAIEEESGSLGGHRLRSAFPNPANPSATIAYELHEPSVVRIAIFDLAGHLVRTLVDGQSKSTGAHTVGWNGRDSDGRAAATGVYLYRLQAGEFSETKRLVLVK